MKISIITPCYNPGKYLLPMLESVKSQMPYVAKHILMDGGSTDGSVKVLEDWAAANPYFEFVSEKDNGQAHACQKALSRVETEYFIWLNADDVLLEGAVTKLLSQIDDDGNIAIVYGDYVRIDGAGKVFAWRKQPSFNYWDCLHGYIFIQNAAALFNASLLRAAGGYDISLRFVMDYDVILKLGKVGQVKHIKEFCGAFRVHETSKTSTIDDVCRKETQELRSRYGVTQNPIVRGLFYRIAKFRVLCRMLLEGCLPCRLRRG